MPARKARALADPSGGSRIYPMRARVDALCASSEGSVVVALSKEALRRQLPSEIIRFDGLRCSPVLADTMLVYQIEEAERFSAGPRVYLATQHENERGRGGGTAHDLRGRLDDRGVDGQRACATTGDGRQRPSTIPAIEREQRREHRRRRARPLARADRADVAGRGREKPSVATRARDPPVDGPPVALDIEHDVLVGRVGGLELRSISAADCPKQRIDFLEGLGALEVRRRDHAISVHADRGGMDPAYVVRRFPLHDPHEVGARQLGEMVEVGEEMPLLQRRRHRVDPRSRRDERCASALDLRGREHLGALLTEDRHRDHEFSGARDRHPPDGAAAVHAALRARLGADQVDPFTRTDPTRIEARASRAQPGPQPAHVDPIHVLHAS
jgi:hypothetical protein